MNQRDRTDTLNKVFETFGSYVFLKKLATGGMAEVFLARPASYAGNGRIQVVKRLLPHVADNEMFLNMFQTEIQVILGFNHPHVVQLHDFGEVEGRAFIAMEYVEGKNLKELMEKFIAQKEKMPVPTALGLVAQAASGLSYAHTFVNKATGETVNAIHRDVTPHNLILSYDGNLKVIDFGIAKAASNMAHEQTSAGTLKGKIAYLSPEQVNSENIDARSDVFTLGVVAWELLTLQRPFNRPGDSEVAILARINNCDQILVKPSSLNKDIPPEIDEIILKALRRDPAQRYASASEFQVALRQAMQKYFPNYSYGETAQIMMRLFGEQILKERNQLRDLNQLAQTALTSQAAGPVDAPTMLIDTTGLSRAAVRSGSPAENFESVDDRLRKIEGLMKKKATVRHYVMLAGYIASIFLIKLDERFSILNFLFASKDSVAQAAPPPAPPSARTPSSAAPHPKAKKIAKAPSHSNRAK